MGGRKGEKLNIQTARLGLDYGASIKNCKNAPKLQANMQVRMWDAVNPSKRWRCQSLFLSITSKNT